MLSKIIDFFYFIISWPVEYFVGIGFIIYAICTFIKINNEYRVVVSDKDISIVNKFYFFPNKSIYKKKILGNECEKTKKIMECFNYKSGGWLKLHLFLIIKLRHIKPNYVCKGRLGITKIFNIYVKRKDKEKYNFYSIIVFIKNDEKRGLVKDIIPGGIDLKNVDFLI